MDVEVKFRGIKPKLVKVPVKNEKPEFEERYIVAFEIYTEDFADACKIKERVEAKLENLLTGQTTLTPEPKGEGEKKK